ncbi:MAG: AMP-binding protein [Bacteroidales bacterium]|nr:AMP-binding protein [Bacteroidales bacterium]
MGTTQFSTLKDLFIYSTNNYQNNKAFSYVGGISYTYTEFRQKTEEFEAILTKAGIGKGDKVIILSQNMPNWPAAYFSITAFGRVAVPILPDFSETEVNNVIEHSEAKAVIVSEKLRYKLPSKTIDNLNAIINIETLETEFNEARITPAEQGDAAHEDLAAIIYTSGTTGNSKGVMLTHRNLCTHLHAAAILRPGFSNDVWLSILPLSHTLESSLSMLLPMVSGSSVYYIEKAPTPTVLLQALKIVRPTTMLSVPMIMEKIYKSSILPKFEKSPAVKFIYRTTPGRKILNRIAGKKLMETFGGRIRFFGIGGAKLDPEVERFLYEAKFPYGIGYGLTESCPLLAGAIPENVKWQSTGPAVHGIELRIDNPNPETGEGEIVAKGPNIMVGYYKNPEATKEAFTEDGWFRTKDLGIIDKTGRLYIKGRLSNMILGPSGENIYPEEIESVINAHTMVSESIVTQKKGKLVALVHFNPDKLKALNDVKEEAFNTYYETKDQITKKFEETKEETKEAMAAFNDKLEQLKRELTQYVNERVNKFSKISYIIDCPQQFEKTATQKIKRFLYNRQK